MAVRSVRQDEHAIASVVGVVLLVASTVASATATYIWATSFSADDAAAPVVTFAQVPDTCGARLLVAAQSGGATWQAMSVRVRGASTYGISAQQAFAASEAWRGDALGVVGDLVPGQSIRLATAEAIASLGVTIVHGPSGAVVFDGSVRVGRADTQPPAGEIDLPEGQGVNLAAVTGSTTDDCSGVGATRIALQRVADGHYLSLSGFSPDPSYRLSTGASWQASFDVSHLQEGQSYRMLAVPVDAAGNEGPVQSKTVVHQAAVPPPPSADLAVVSLLASPPSPEAGASVVFTAQVTNLGAGAAPAFRVRFLVDGAAIGLVDVGGLAAGASVSVPSTAWAAVSGPRAVAVEVDALEEIAESDEANNDASLALAVAEHLPGASNANKTCAANVGPGQSWIEFKIDEDPAEGVYTDGTIVVTISNKSGNRFDWSANVGVDAVIVKDGIDGANVYRYDAPLERTAGEGVSTPFDGRRDISHVSFCYD